MRLSDYLEPEYVLLDLRTTGIQDTLEAISDRLSSAPGTGDRGAILQALLERETAHSTSLGNGVALPHATVPEVDRPVVLIGRAPDGVAFGDDAGQPVRLFVVLLSPLEEAGTHIKLLARIVRLVRRPGFVSALMEAGSPEELVEMVEHMDALHV